MPYNDGNIPDSRSDSDARYQLVNVQERLNKVTRLLCTILKAVTKDGLFDKDLRVLLSGMGIPRHELTEICSWWKEHQEHDTKREEEKIRKSALSKLTPKEKKVLGIK